MGEPALPDEAIRRYWLGLLSLEEEHNLERILGTAGPANDRARVIREELIDDYLFEKLSPEERTAFERHFLRVPEHREQLEMVRLLIRKLAPNRLRGVD